ncbi:MAG: uridine kinase, partial [Candidatus Marinimicrobia bacterium]|nr:uridine kinase [Candidatus Neomarinimicrobiota bacterium]
DHLNKLFDNQPANIPIYDFSTHTRQNKIKKIQPHPVILLEGIMVLTNATLRNMMDIKIFVETDPDIRFIRRLERDLLERNRTLEHVIKQYKSTVKPMHEQFVEITKKYADIILPEGANNEVALNLIRAKIKTQIKKAVLTN